MWRRRLRSAMMAVALGGTLTSQRGGPSRGPQLWLISRGGTRVYVFGFGEARDSSWLSPPIRNAFEQSSQLWLETALASAATDQSPAEQQATAERLYAMGHESGRTLFDALERPVRKRTLAYLAELGVPKDSVQTLRPWRAYYSIVSAFWSKRVVPTNQVNVDAVLAEMAQAEGKSIRYEFPTAEAFTIFMATMRDRTQSQYIEWLLDFLDDYKNGLNDDEEILSWVRGDPGSSATRSLNRMRTRTPDLYQVMQVQRNAWWARKVYDLLAREGTYFVAVGQLHVLGPDGIPRQLERLGVKAELVP
jgi:uncharacterized protein